MTRSTQQKRKTLRDLRKTTEKVAKREQVSTSEPDSIEIGPPKLTRFERATVVGARALQVSIGAPVLLDLKDPTLSPIDIALIQLDEGVHPISIRRALPDATSQNIPLKWLLDSEEEIQHRVKKE